MARWAVFVISAFFASSGLALTPDGPGVRTCRSLATSSFKACSQTPFESSSVEAGGSNCSLNQNQALASLTPSARASAQVTFLGRLQSTELNRLSGNRQYIVGVLECIQLETFSARDRVAPEKRERCDDQLRRLRGTIEKLSTAGLLSSPDALDEFPFLKFYKPGGKQALVDALMKWMVAVQSEYDRVQRMKDDDLLALLKNNRLVDEIYLESPLEERAAICSSARALEKRRQDQESSRANGDLALSMGATGLCVLSGGAPCIVSMGLYALYGGDEAHKRYSEAQAEYKAGRICSEDLVHAKKDAATSAFFVALSIAGVKGGGAAAASARASEEALLAATAKTGGAQGAATAGAAAGVGAGGASKVSAALDFIRNSKEGFKEAIEFHKTRTEELVKTYGPRLESAGTNEEAKAVLASLKTEVDSAVANMKPHELYSYLEGFVRHTGASPEVGQILGIARDAGGAMGVKGALPGTFGEVLRDAAKGLEGNRDLAQIARTRFNNLAFGQAEEMVAVMPKMQLNMFVNRQNLQEAYSARAFQEFLTRVQKGDASLLQFLKTEGFDSKAIKSFVEEMGAVQNMAW